jgi:signal transduction histidine kinase
VKAISLASSDEIGEIARAFDQMRADFLRQAANEAALHAKLTAMFLNLSQRSQSLVERQNRLIDHLEQGEQDAARRAALFKMGRIAARMQRSSQNLLILAGHELTSSWNQPVPLADVIRAAAFETEDGERVSLNGQPDVAVRGPVVNDLVHLLAELTENATSFSSADMPVDISGQLLATGGALVDITDRGIGMAAKEMAYANWQLENLPAADITVPRWMGLSVVARLATQHGIRVRLHSAEFGGLKALVWLPEEVLTQRDVTVSLRLGASAGTGSAPGFAESAADRRRAAAGTI